MSRLIGNTFAAWASAGSAGFSAGSGAAARAAVAGAAGNKAVVCSGQPEEKRGRLTARQGKRRSTGKRRGRDNRIAASPDGTGKDARRISFPSVVGDLNFVQCERVHGFAKP